MDVVQRDSQAAQATQPAAESLTPPDRFFPVVALVVLIGLIAAWAIISLSR
jgi:hypothetical protein